MSDVRRHRRSRADKARAAEVLIGMLDDDLIGHVVGALGQVGFQMTSLQVRWRPVEVIGRDGVPIVGSIKDNNATAHIRLDVADLVHLELAVTTVEFRPREMR